jgi:hypothetical protein
LQPEGRGGFLNYVWRTAQLSGIWAFDLIIWM